MNLIRSHSWEQPGIWHAGSRGWLGIRTGTVPASWGCIAVYSYPSGAGPLGRCLPHGDVLQFTIIPLVQDHWDSACLMGMYCSLQLSLWCRTTGTVPASWGCIAVYNCPSGAGPLGQCLPHGDVLQFTIVPLVQDHWDSACLMGMYCSLQLSLWCRTTGTVPASWGCIAVYIYLWYRTKASWGCIAVYIHFWYRTKASWGWTAVYIHFWYRTKASWKCIAVYIHFWYRTKASWGWTAVYIHFWYRTKASWKCIAVYIHFWYRTKAALAAAAEGGLVARTGSNPFGPGGATEDGLTACVDEPDIEAEGIEVALVCAERVAALLAANALKGATPGIKVGRRADRQGLNPKRKGLMSLAVRSLFLCLQELNMQAKAAMQLRCCLPVR